MYEVIKKLIEKEAIRQSENVELIASENFVSPMVLEAMGSCLTNKYAEGYPTERISGNKGRYYGGCEVVNEIEEYCCSLWRKVFNTDYHVNVQPHSGSQANACAYAAVLRPGDTILAMNLNNGGHLSHGSPVNFSGKLYDVKFYDVDENGFIDYEDLENKIRYYKPKLVLAGASAYSRIIDFERIHRIIQSIKLDNFIAALGIDGVGISAAKTISKYFKGSFTEFNNAFWNRFDFTKLDDIGETTANSIDIYMANHSEEVYALANEMNFIVEETKSSGINLNGKSFCITGSLEHFANRDALVQSIEAHGGKYVSSVSKKTDYLINNDKTSTSGKNKKAMDLNIPIISEEDFINMIGE